MIKQLSYRLFRNRYDMKYGIAPKNRVNLEYSKTVNIGDTLSPLIVNWMLQKKNLTLEQPVRGIKHLMAVGSVIGRGRFNVTLWGTGVLKDDIQQVLKKQIKYRHIDVRAVRGPRSRKMLLSAGYDCPEVYGDPAILMPMIYPIQEIEPNYKKYPVSLILHHRTKIVLNKPSNEDEFQLSLPKELLEDSCINIIDPNTADYRSFITQIVQSTMIISASLHGIILAESYGIPAMFLNFGVQDQEIKFHDWYESTGREIKCEKSVENALRSTPLPLPQLSDMQKQIMAVFPYDLWS